MDHDEALRLQAGVKYVLGELPQALRDEYEEHYFECAECGLEVRAAAVFSDNARNVLCQAEREASLKAAAPAGGRWLTWLRPALAIPATAILLGVVAYQNLVTLPSLKSGAAWQAQVFKSFSLVGANVRDLRGEAAVKIQVHPSETFALDFDFLPAKQFDHYLCQLQDETGRAVLQASMPADKAKQEVHLLVPHGVEHAGRYSVVLSGDPGAKGSWRREYEVSRMNFMVEWLP